MHRHGNGSGFKQPVLGLWMALLLLLYHCCGCHSITEQLQLQSNGKLGLVLPLEIRHGVHRARGRSLLRRSGIAAVLGAVREGYFYAVLNLGTPPRQFSTIIDTGSTMTYIPCKNCLRCGKHMDEAFDPSQSKTAIMLGCQDKRCSCGSPSCTCKDQKCYYARHYAEMSSSEGWLVADKLAFPDNGTSLDFVFGCENIETGAIYEQHVDGVLGMGNNLNSFPRQLARSGQVDDVFSLCFGFPAGGSLLLGDVPLEPALQLQYTPLVERHLHYYNVDLLSISLDGTTLPVSKAQYGTGYGAVLDSGTTFTYLPSVAFKSFLGLLETALKGSKLRRSSGADPQYNDICWRGGPRDFKGIDQIFPSGSVTFAGDVTVRLTPERYLFKVGRGEYCLGVFDNGWQGTLIGGIIVRNVLVQYDKERQRVGFAEADCNQLRSAAPAATTTGPVGSGASQAPPAAAASPQPAAAASAGAAEPAHGSPAPTAATGGTSTAAKGAPATGELDDYTEDEELDWDVEAPQPQDQQQQQQGAAAPAAGDDTEQQQYRQQAEQHQAKSGQQQQQQQGQPMDSSSSMYRFLSVVAGGGLLAVAVAAAVQAARKIGRGGRAGSDDDVDLGSLPAAASAATAAASSSGLLSQALGGRRVYRAITAAEPEDLETELTPLALSAGARSSAAV